MYTLPFLDVVLYKSQIKLVYNTVLIFCFFTDFCFCLSTINSCRVRGVKICCGCGSYLSPFNYLNSYILRLLWSAPSLSLIVLFVCKSILFNILATPALLFTWHIFSYLFTFILSDPSLFLVAYSWVLLLYSLW